MESDGFRFHLGKFSRFVFTILDSSGVSVAFGHGFMPHYAGFKSKLATSFNWQAARLEPYFRRL